MGLILDSSVLIAAERQGQSVRHMLAGIALTHSDTELAISVITLIELAQVLLALTRQNGNPIAINSLKIWSQACRFMP